MRSACGHEDVEGGWEVIVDVYREIERMGDSALRNETKDRCSTFGSVRVDSILRMAVVLPWIGKTRPSSPDPGESALRR